MTDDSEYLSLLRDKVQRIMTTSPSNESMPGFASIPHDPALPTGPHAESAQLEAVVRWYRPVLAVTDDRFVSQSGDGGGDPRFVDPNEAASKGLVDDLEAHRAVLDPVIRSVGRIELNNNVRYP